MVGAVIDTNVFVAALARKSRDNRGVLRLCLEEKVRPLMGQNLFLEYEEVLGRGGLFANSPLLERERNQLFEGFLSVCEWVEVFFLLRPNLRDEEDNHVMELAVAGGASRIVTNNVRDFTGSQLRFPQIRVVRPGEFLKEMQ